MSVSHFERNVQPELRVVRSGQLVLIPVAEIEKWLQRNAHLVMPPVGGSLTVRRPGLRSREVPA